MMMMMATHQQHQTHHHALPTTTFTPQQQYDALPHGTKRKAKDELENEQRLSKRFDLLNLEHTGKLWTPPPGVQPPPMRKTSNDAIFESMQVEDTPERVYIHNLDEELAEIEREEQEHGNEERLIFIPDIDRKLNKIPDRVLRGEDEWQPTGTEMVLYSVPSSLTVSEENDSVKRAILEVRQRQRALQQGSVQQIDSRASQASGTNGGMPASAPVDSTSRTLSPIEQNDDDNAMDLG